MLTTADMFGIFCLVVAGAAIGSAITYWLLRGPGILREMRRRRQWSRNVRDILRRDEGAR